MFFPLKQQQASVSLVWSFAGPDTLLLLHDREVRDPGKDGGVCVVSEKEEEYDDYEAFEGRYPHSTTYI